MIERMKFCMLGATGVGKTSLVARYVRSIFSDVYRTTIGVQIHARRLQLPGREIELLLWDMNGEDEFQHVQLSYVRGAAGYLLVMDGTRPATARTALDLRNAAVGSAGEMPCVLAVNKVDLVESWDPEVAQMEALERVCDASIATSARTGTGVAEAFDRLVHAALESRGRRLGSFGRESSRP